MSPANQLPLRPQVVHTGCCIRLPGRLLLCPHRAYALRTVWALAGSVVSDTDALTPHDEILEYSCP